MDNPRTLNDKYLYKLFISCIKYIPIVLLFITTLGTTLNYFQCNSVIPNLIGGTSIIFILLLYLMSYVFRFCYLYRLPLYFITIINIFVTLVKLGIVVISSITLYRIFVILLGLFLIVYIICAYKNRNAPKVDYIKDLCKRYCQCE